VAVRSFAVGAAVFTLLIGGWIASLSAAPKPRESAWIKEIYEKKESVAASVTDPKYVLVGGSSTHYSYSAEAVSRATGLPVINLGTHAGLGGDYILNRAKASLRTGDTAVLALEYQLFSSTPPSTVLASFVATNDPGYILDAPSEHLAALIFGYSPVQLLRDIAIRTVPWTSPLYRSETVTAYGDESSNTPDHKLPYMHQVVHEAGAIGMADADHMQMSSAFRKFIGWASENGVTVFYTWPPTTSRAEYQTEQYVAYFRSYRSMMESLGVKVLGAQADYVIPEEEMLDSMYHADSRGALRVSAVLARNLCEAVSCGQSQGLLSR
jgi:hypothetical protein